MFLKIIGGGGRGGGCRKAPLPLILQKCVYASKFLIISYWLI